MTWGALAERVAAATPPPAPVALELDTPRLTPGQRLLQLVSDGQRTRITKRVGLTIPAMRTGHAKITKMPATWPLRFWTGDRLSAKQPAWLTNPDPALTFLDLFADVMDDAVWHDRAYLRVTRRGVDGFPLAFRRIPIDLVQEQPDGSLLIDGKSPGEAFPDDPGPVIFPDTGRILEHVVRMDWHGLGGLSRDGSPIVNLALDLLGAATNYARSPIPQTTLYPDGTTGQLDDDEVDALLVDYEEKRATRSTAYLQGVKAEHNGFSAKDLQLVESREHSALEVARALALPAWAVEASNGASLQYSTVVDTRRDLVEALRLWVAPFEQALSLHAAPRGTDVRFDVASYLRDDATTRATVWAAGLAGGWLTLDDVIRQEPLAGGGA